MGDNKNYERYKKITLLVKKCYTKLDSNGANEKPHPFGKMSRTTIMHTMHSSYR